MHRFVCVSFYFGGRAKIAELEPIFTAIADDWIRFSALSWILWTGKPAPHIFTLLEPHLSEEDQVMVAAIPDGLADFYGYFPNWIWDWMKSKEPDRFVIGEGADEIRRLPAAAFPNAEE